MKFCIKKQGDNMMFLPNNMYTPTKTFPTSAMLQTQQKQDENKEKNEIIVLQNKIVELQKNLNEEILKKNVPKNKRLIIKI